MKKIIDTQLTEDANEFGEILREYAFVESLGAYTCSDLIDEFTELEDSELIKKLQIAMGIHESQDDRSLCYSPDELREDACYYSNGNTHLAWSWDGDGTLAIIEGDKCAVNTDCKKTYGWEWSAT